MTTTPSKQPRTRPGTETAEVRLYTSPWPPTGQRTAAYGGPVYALEFRPDGESFDGLFDHLQDQLARQALENGCNVVVGVEFTVYPWTRRGDWSGTSASASGTAARVEPLRSGGQIPPGARTDAGDSTS